MMNMPHLIDDLKNLDKKTKEFWYHARSLDFMNMTALLNDGLNVDPIQEMLVKFAIQKNSIALVDFLIENKVKIDLDNPSLFELAAKHGDLKMCLYLEGKGFLPPTTLNRRSGTFLLFAVIENKIDLVEYFHSKNSQSLNSNYIDSMSNALDFNLEKEIKKISNNPHSGEEHFKILKIITANRHLDLENEHTFKILVEDDCLEVVKIFLENYDISHLEQILKLAIYCDSTNVINYYAPSNLEVLDKVLIKMEDENSESDPFHVKSLVTNIKKVRGIYNTFSLKNDLNKNLVINNNSVAPTLKV